MTMSDETKTEDTPELDSSASQAELKAAADDLLKNAPKPESEAKSGEDGDQQDEELTPDQLIMALEAEKEEMHQQYLRALAELQNVRKRAEREVRDARIYGIEKFAADLLSVSDNMARALEALSEDEIEGLSEPGKNLLGGVEMTAKELSAALQRHGVAPIAAEPGDAFDPNQHQAVANIPSNYPNGTIAELFQAGWKIGNRTLRAAMVAVSSGEAPESS